MLCLFCAFAGTISLVNAQALTDNIRLNQVGFYPAAPKLAVVTGAGDKALAFRISSPDLSTTVFKGTLRPAPGAVLGSRVRVADFSACTKPGLYVVSVPGVGKSYPFRIGPDAHLALAKAALKSYYYQRASTELPARYAGPWSRPAGHPDTRVLVHASAATAQRPTGTVISSSRGWYDAGDYNKYIVNSGITMGTMLSLYEDFPAYCTALRADIPESANDVPDVLDEALWNLRWMLTMQDPGDGGVYHKLTNANFDGMVMPEKVSTPRYVVQKSTAAALDFAAVMAQASRIARRFERQLPGLADSCLRASTRAWQWAQANPQQHYRQDDMNKQFSPPIVTGGYGDQNVGDEKVWAAAELFVTTREPAYYEAVRPALQRAATLPSWGQVQTLALYTLARFRAELPAPAQADAALVSQRLMAMADTLRAGSRPQVYQTVMGRRQRDFSWGSNANAANQGIALVQAFRLSGNRQYLHDALANLDYLLGRNATGYSFVTGHGSKTPLHPHHRLSEGDAVAAPLPGFLAGGPNPGRQDKCNYPYLQPDKSYVDQVCSYASNEIAINWNAPLVYLAVALEALQPSLPPASAAPKK
ncbi:MAG TPA: glycoside hydrolase family 9 protein [Hymenobacter sp.]|uniref:glycoside hydrolase family 9 protein n=1 Tax=Hymenobacter sp. TaxID=1898978 RepID=UPI002EDB9827